MQHTKHILHMDIESRFVSAKQKLKFSASISFVDCFFKLFCWHLVVIIKFGFNLFIIISDSGFVVLQGTTYWTDLFVRHFLFQSEPVHSIDSDDLLFFVRKKHVKSSSRHMPKYEVGIQI